jgi:hypothetical protein
MPIQRVTDLAIANQSIARTLVVSEGQFEAFSNGLESVAERPVTDVVNKCRS